MNKDLLVTIALVLFVYQSIIIVCLIEIYLTLKQILAYEKGED